ncbi:MAG: helix-turn-helix domain-containing protein [Cryomorphaceae bacterium]|jgi:predicted DNA-binding transcriptional regulator YafY|nr:helix-turn-helix domain-containing protein [Cryomorphaceae bacterium]
MNIQKIKHLIHLIQKEGTGSPTELAERLELSERMVYNYVRLLKDELRAPVEYNKFRRSYYFSEPGRILWEWRPASGNNARVEH